MYMQILKSLKQREKEKNESRNLYAYMVRLTVHKMHISIPVCAVLQWFTSKLANYMNQFYVVVNINWKQQAACTKRCYGVTVLMVPRPNDKCQWDDLTLMLNISESGRAKVALELSGNFKKKKFANPT